MINIRYATIEDAALIAAISRETFYETFAAFNTASDMQKFMDEQFSVADLMAQVADPAHHYFLVYDDNQAVGYTFLIDRTHPSLKSSLSLEIARIYIRQSAIGKGIGKALMNRAISFAQSQQKNAVWLGVWEHNQRAIDFYLSLGFSKFGEHDFLLGDDVQRDWLMVKQIN
jgi:ribosomal protein S18 acetylase RimI-like enzyme